MSALSQRESHSAAKCERISEPSDNVVRFAHHEASVRLRYYRRDCAIDANQVPMLNAGVDAERHREESSSI